MRQSKEAQSKVAESEKAQSAVLKFGILEAEGKNGSLILLLALKNDFSSQLQQSFASPC